MSSRINDVYSFSIDMLSKIYVTASWLTGLNRLPVAFKIKGYWNILSLSYSLFLNIVIGYYVFLLNLNEIISIVRILNVIQYLICSFIAIKSGTVVKKFYIELYEFDKDLKYQWPTTMTAVFNFGFSVIAVFVTIIIFSAITRLVEIVSQELVVLTIMDLSMIIEGFYNGHLFSLLEIRLKTIRILLLSYFPYTNQRYFTENENINFEDKNISKLLIRNPEVEIRKLLLLYHKIIKAYDYLYTAIKWQVFTTVITSFTTILNVLYFMMFQHVNKYEYENLHIIPGIGLVTIRAIPFLVYCFSGSNIANEAALLHSAVLTRTHRNVFDIENRSYATLFLDLIQARSLTFSVFRMIEINTTLPFKFLGLLATYLLILMQFEKVLHFENEN
nr:gustatory receptor 18 [Papilio memnon]